MPDFRRATRPVIRISANSAITALIVNGTANNCNIKAIGRQADPKEPRTASAIIVIDNQRFRIRMDQLEG